MKVLVTGASGFVGQSLIKALKQRDMNVVGVGRQLTKSNAGTFFPVLDFTIQEAWQEPLVGCDVVIHLAARVHIMSECSADPLTEFRKVNVDGTKCLAEVSARAGIKRLIYLSSVKVNGEKTTSPYTELDVPDPQDPYGVSKWEAEQALHKISAKTGLEVVILRSPLVYGAGVKGNFAQMIKVLAKGIPLPLSSVQNLRSLIYIENLVYALVLCATHPIAAGKTYLVSDGEDVSTPELLRKLGEAMGRPARLFCCPPALLLLTGRLVGKSDQINRLLGSLQVDSSKIRRQLGWEPPFSLNEGLKATVKEIRDKL